MSKQNNAASQQHALEPGQSPMSAYSCSIDTRPGKEMMVGPADDSGGVEWYITDFLFEAAMRWVRETGSGD